jgi:WD40 repeat protein
MGRGWPAWKPVLDEDEAWKPAVLRVWDVADGRELFAVERDLRPPGEIVFSPGGQYLAVVTLPALTEQEGRKKLYVMEAATGRDVLVREGSFGCVAFSPDGGRVAAGTTVDRVSGLSELRAWELPAGRDTFPTRRSHVHPIQHLAFSPDGRRLATAGGDYSGGPAEVKLWDAAGQELLSLRRGDGNAGQLAFTPDGHRLILTTIARPPGSRPRPRPGCRRRRRISRIKLAWKPSGHQDTLHPATL